jgi:hypothetical protein
LALVLVLARHRHDRLQVPSQLQVDGERSFLRVDHALLALPRPLVLARLELLGPLPRARPRSRRRNLEELLPVEATQMLEAARASSAQRR